MKRSTLIYAALMVTLRFVMPVLGHVLEHMPEHILQHVPKHVPDRHVLARHVPEHMLARHVLGLKKLSKFLFYAKIVLIST